MAWANRAAAAGLVGGGALLRLSSPDSLPEISLADLDRVIKDQQCKSLTVVNMRYARLVLGTNAPAPLMPSVPYHVMLGRTPMATIEYLERVLPPAADDVIVYDKPVWETVELDRGYSLNGACEVSFEELSSLTEAMRNARGAAAWTSAYSRQFFSEQLFRF